MEVLQTNTNLPLGQDSDVKFTLKSKENLDTNFDNVLFKGCRDPLRSNDLADHPLAGEFEDPMTASFGLQGDNEYFRPGQPDKQRACNNAPSSRSVALLAAAGARFRI